jgi:hypothetical protein
LQRQNKFKEPPEDEKIKIEGDDYSCMLCNLGIEEYTYHLFQCPFSEWCWNSQGIQWGHGLSVFNTIKKAKSEWQYGFFMEVFSIALWEIWKQRNERIFRAPPPYLPIMEGELHLCR